MQLSKKMKIALDETRMLILVAQILLGFQFRSVFQSGFEDLPRHAQLVDGVALLLIEDHIDGCLTHAIETGQGRKYVDEVMTVVRRAMGRKAPRTRAATD